MLRYQVTDELRKHWRGETVLTSADIHVVKNLSGNRDRLETLKSLVCGRRVIHVGCCDHLETIEVKAARGDWLHGFLTSAAGRCYGIDINAEAVDYVKKHLNYDNLECHDLTSSELCPAIVKNAPWDFILLGEILEHVDNPVSFLSRIAKLYSPSVTKMIITVPNAFRLENWLGALAGRELINTDHRYWFTVFTLGKIMTQAGLEVYGYDLVHNHRRSVIKKLFALVTAVWPITCNTIIMAADLRPPKQP